MKKITLLAIAILTSISCNAINYFWVNGSGNWSDYAGHWATSSGGSAFHNQVPQSTDNVFFDAFSFTPAMHTVTVDQPIIQCADMTWTGLPTIAPTLVGNSSDTLRIFGSLTLLTGMTFNFNGQLSMETITAATITTAGTVINASLAFNGIGNIGGSWILQDALTVTNSIYLNNGTLNTNNQTVNTFAFYSSTASVRSLIMGTSTFNLSNFWYINPAGMTLNATNSTINYSGTSGSYLFFLGGGLTYNDVFFTGGGWGYIYNNNILHDVSFVSDGFISGNNIFHDVSFAANATINGLNSFNNVSIANNGTINNSNTFNNLTFSPFYSYTLEAGQTQTVENICAKGTGALPIRIQSSVAGLPAIISKASGTMCWDYVHVSDITATGGATFNAGLAPTNSQDLGGNTGLLFTGGCIFVPCTSCTPPVITAQPSNSNVCTDGNTVFEIFATGTGLTYQWQVNDGSGFTNLFNMPPYSGVTTNTLNITSVALPANGYQYHCIVSGACDSIIISNEGTLTVNSLPTVTANSATICSGQTAILTANGATNYVWSIGGMMGDTTNPISVSPLNTTAYIVTGTTNGCSNSAIATVTVNPLPIINAGQDATVLSNTPVQLGTTSFPALSYSWSPIGGLSNANVSNPTLILQNNSSTPQTYTYILTATNGQCSKSDTVLITVLGSQPIPNPNLNQISDSTFTQNVIPCGVSPEYFKSLGLSGGGGGKGGENPISLSLPDAFPANLIQHCGHFDVFYEDLINTNAQVGYADPVWGADRRAVLCAVLTYVETVFDFNGVPAGAPIRLHVDNSFAPGANPAPNTARFLAYAGPVYTTSGDPIVNGFVHDYTVLGTDPTGINQYHAELTTNFDQAFDYLGNPVPIPWNNTVAPATTNCLFDLYSVLLHEITHTLGWTSLVQINNANLLEPANTPLNIFSGIDALLYRSPSPAPPVGLQPFILGAPSNPSINPAASALPNNDFWIGGNPAPDNHPVYSGLLYSNWGGSEVEQSYLSHMDGQMWLYSTRSRVSPGDVQDYVMQPYSARGVLRRTYTDIEINTLTDIGYTINPNFPGIPNLPNLPPYSTKMALYGSHDVFNYDFPETVLQDALQLTNNSGSSLAINIATDPDNIDPEGNPITIFPGSLVNIRGCGSGGNNHNQLTVSNNQVVTFTPRPDFYGRAQFGLKLFDGSEVGSYVIYTIDVVRGTNVDCPVGDNMILNGDFEEGTEVKRLGAEEVIDAAQQEDYWLKEGKVRTGIQFADCQPYCFTSNNVGPYGSGDIIQNSWISCNGTTYRSDAGSANTTFPTPGSNAPKLDALNGIGQRYKQLQGDYMYFNLCSDMQPCGKYLLEFDFYAQPFFITDGTTIPLTVGFTNAATYPALANLEYSFIHNFTVANSGNTANWQHVTIPFTYCSNIPTNILNLLQSAEGVGIFIDNLQLKVDPNPPPVTVSIAPIPAITCSSIDLYSQISNHQCMTYSWAPGGETTANINVTPSVIGNTTYTLTVSTSNSCGQTAAVLSTTTTVTKIPMPTISLGPNPSVCKGATTANLTYSGTTTADQYSIRYDPAALAAGFLDVPYTSTPNLPASPFVLPIPPGALPGTYNFTLKIKILGTDGCEVITPCTVTIKPVPVATATPTAQWICTGTTTAIALSSIPTGATFSWTVVQTTDVSGASAGTGNTIAQTLTVAGATPSGTATYTITPEINGCFGSPITVVVTVSKVPDVTASPSSQTICSGNITSIALTGTYAGTQFAWSAVPLGVSGTSNGTGTAIAQTLTTSTTTAGTATYNITPYLNACPGTPITATVSINPTPVATATPASQPFCSTGTTAIALTSNVAGTDFAWTVNQTGVSGATNGSGTNIAQILNIIGNTPGTAVYTITPTVTATGCSGTPITVTIYINPIPVATANPVSQTICSGSTTSIVLSNNVTGTTYSWTAMQTGVSGAAGASGFAGTSISQILNATGTIQGTVVYTITPIANNCSGTPRTVTISVNPTPVAIATPASQTFCSTGTTAIALTSDVAGTDFAWTVIQTGVLGATNGSGTNIAQILNITGNTQGTAVYTITPTVTATGCSGTPITVTIFINPIPTMTSVNSKTICSGSAVNISLTSNVTSAYTWIATDNPNTTGESITQQTAGTLNDNIINTTTSNKTVSYTVTPTSSPEGCVGASQAVNVTVRPAPTMTNASSATICSGGTVNITLTSNIATTKTWIATDNPNTTGESTTLQTGSPLINTIINNSAVVQTVIYTVTPTSTVGICVGSPQTVIVTANPAPAMTSPVTATICSGAMVSIPLTSNITSTYSWKAANNLNTTGESVTNQTSNPLNNTITNNTAVVQTVTYTVTPISSPQGCAGTPQTVMVTVNPKPVMTSPVTATICSGSNVSIALTSNVASTFTWVATDNVNTTGESTALQTGGILTNTITNSTATNQTVSYTVTPTSNPVGCIGTAQTVTVTVRPAPIMTSVNNATICNGSTINIPLTSNIVATKTWIATDNTNTTGESITLQTGGPLNNTITNNSTVNQSVTYIVTPTSTVGGCVGSSQTVIISVRPTPTMTNANTATICSGSPLSIPLTSNIPSTYIWKAANNLNTTGESLTNQTGSSLNNTIINNTAAVQTVTYTVNPTSMGVPACQGTPQILTVTVNPSPVASANPASPTICSGGTTSIALLSNIPGTTYSWSVVQAGVSGAFGVTNYSGTSITQPLTVTTGTSGTVIYKITPIVNGCPGSQISVTVTVITSCCTNMNCGTAGEIFYNANVTKMLPPNLTGFATPGSSGIPVTVTGKCFSISGNFNVSQNLLLSNCNIQLAPNARIIINNGSQLTLNNCNLYACTEMWEGLSFIGGNLPNTLLTVNNSSIEDAINAIVSVNGRKFTITNSILNKNLFNIVVKSFTGNHPGTIKNTRITCAPYGTPGATAYTHPGAFLRAPYSTSKSVFGIEITNVKNIQIGDDANINLQNTFDNLFMGIASRYSNVTVFNNKFNNVTYGINAIANVSAPKSITVGGATSNRPNIFINSINNPNLATSGLLITDNMNLNAESNQFTNLLNGIEVANCKSRNIQVQNNQFINFSRNGISCTDVGNSTVGILNNKFNQGVTPLSTSAIGIQVRNVNRVAMKLTITDNLIDWVRLGIWMTNTAIINDNNTNNYQSIRLNTITFSQSVTQITSSSSPYCGIRAEGADKANFVTNTLLRGNSLPTPSGTLSSKLQGMHIENSQRFSANDNAAHDMGQGMTFTGNNNNSKITCNSLKNCYDGIRLEPPVTIGNQINPGQPQASDNKWQHPSLNYDITGGPMDVQTKWYYRSNMGPNFIPYILAITKLSFEIKNSAGGTCNAALRSMQQPVLDSIREHNFGSIVRNQILYNNLPFENKFADREFAFQSLVQDSLLNLGTADDSVYQNFYTAMSNSNSGLFQEVQEISEQYDVPSALTKNSAIAPSCLMENNRKAVNEIYLNTWLSGVDTFTVSQQTDLENIAYQNPLVGGVAVYSARVLLKIEVNEGQTAPNKKLTIGTLAEQSLFGKFYPNPANNNATLNYQLAKGQSAYLELFDITGVKMARYELDAEGNQLIISCSNLQVGIYLYRIITNDAIAASGKLVIMK